jgi:predicted O-methyltransferase YrrM
MDTNILNGVKGGVSTREGMFLMEQAKMCPAELPIIEIGSWEGGSTAWMGRDSLDGNGAKVYAIDPHYEDTWEIFGANMKRAGVEKAIIPMKETSLEAHEHWDKGPIGFLWIDGDHSYEGISLDIKLWEPELVDGKMIAFHDVTHRNLGVYRAVKEKIIHSHHYKNLGFVHGILYGTKTKKEYPAILWLVSRASIMTQFHLIFLKQRIARVIKPLINIFRA